MKGALLFKNIHTYFLVTIFWAVRCTGVVVSSYVIECHSVASRANISFTLLTL